MLTQVLHLISFFFPLTVGIVILLCVIISKYKSTMHAPALGAIYS